MALLARSASRMSIAAGDAEPWFGRGVTAFSDVEVAEPVGSTANSTGGGMRFPQASAIILLQVVLIWPEFGAPMREANRGSRATLCPRWWRAYRRALPRPSFADSRLPPSGCASAKAGGSTCPAISAVARRGERDRRPWDPSGAGRAIRL